MCSAQLHTLFSFFFFLREALNQPQVYSFRCTYWQLQPDAWGRRCSTEIGVSSHKKNDSSAMSAPVPDCAGARIAVDSHSVPRKRPFQLKVNSLVCTKIEPSELFTVLPEYPLGLSPICSAHELSNENQHSLQLPIKKTCPFFYLMQFVMEKLLHAPRQPFVDSQPPTLMVPLCRVRAQQCGVLNKNRHQRFSLFFRPPT